MIKNIKNIVKRNEIIYDTYINGYRLLLKMLVKKNPKLATQILYRKMLGHRLDLKHPVTMTEKMQWLKLNIYQNNPMITRCIDKYEVRNYIIEKGCSEILNVLYGVWDKFEDIDFQRLPNSFVLKCNHGCGYNLICKDKSSFDYKDAEKKIKRWMSEEYGDVSAEIIYNNINKRIICEKLIESEDGKPLNDYKIFCSYGEPRLIYVVTGGHDDEMCLDYYTTEWEWIPVKNGILPNAQKKTNKPKKLNEMLNYARILSSDFPLVRVDLYCEFGRIYFGELTFLATGGMFRLNPQKYDRIFGDLFPIY